MSKLEVTTKFNHDLIEQSISGQDRIERMSKQVIKLQDEGIKEALKRLGYLAPENAEGLQLQLTAALEREQALAAQLKEQDAPLRSIPRLKQQIASSRDEYEKKLRQCVELMHERDACMAHACRLREALHQALIHWGAHCTDEDGTAYVECEARCNETPTTSLARRDLIKQAEALEEAYKHTDDAAAQDYLHDTAAAMRQRATQLDQPT